MIERVTLLFNSIRFRLALWFVFILGVVVVLFSVFVYTRQVRDLKEAAVSRLEYKTDRLAASLRYTIWDYFDRTPLGLPTDPSSGETLFQDGDILALITTGGRVVRSWGPSEASRVSLLVEEGLSGEDFRRPLSSRVYDATILIDETPTDYVMALVPVVSDRRLAGYFFLGNPIDPDRQLPRLGFSLALGTLITLGVALFGGFWLADRAIHPVKQITETARSIGETDLNRRIHLNRKDELGELADTFDGMLERLQAAFDRQRQFTADASHELRTPLTIVDLETSRALKKRQNPEEYERVLRIVNSENQFMVRLVNNLLTLARMDAGQETLDKDEVDLSDVTLEVVERLAPIAANERVRLSAGALPEVIVLGDRQHLFQMITNLVENAIKYSEGDERRVEVETGARADPADAALAWVRIADNGPGIPPEHLPLLFDRFYQIDRARSRSNHEQEDAGEQAPSGTGLGLSIAQWIARAHGGEITVQSEPGRGSVFEVVLPLQPR